MRRRYIVKRGCLARSATEPTAPQSRAYSRTQVGFSTLISRIGSGFLVNLRQAFRELSVAPIIGEQWRRGKTASGQGDYSSVGHSALAFFQDGVAGVGAFPEYRKLVVYLARGGFVPSTSITWLG